MTKEIFGHVQKTQSDDLQHVINLTKDINAKNSKGQTALHLAVWHGNPVAVDLLLKNGANVDVLDAEHKTALEYAAQKQNKEMIKILMKYGATKHAESALLLLCEQPENTEVAVTEISKTQTLGLDTVTGLPNRQTFIEILKKAIARSKRMRCHVLLFYVDINHFKDINDTLGHRVGDQLLKEIGRRLQEELREMDSVARVGNDEFLVMFEDVTHEVDGGMIAEKILQKLSEEYQVEGNEVHVSANIGIAMSSPEMFDPDVLVTRAGVALHQAKEQGVNQYVYFSQEINVVIQKRTLLSRKLVTALDNDEFRLFYQPQVEIESNAIVGSEALIRWHHPQIGNIPPFEFIPILESMGLIEEVTLWVIEQAICQHEQWIKTKVLAPDTHVSVNLSARDFRNAELVLKVTALLKKYKMPPQRLHVEITEGVFISHHKEALEKLRALHDLGLQIALDDFGTGYSSLRYLKEFPIDIIKIDRAFVKDVLHNPEDAAITSAIVSLAETLQIKLIAEGVEDKSVLKYLESLGCDYYQGYLCSPPVDVEAWEKLVKNWRVDVRS